MHWALYANGQLQVQVIITFQQPLCIWKSFLLTIDFLPGQPGETHNRQESADSGLGMGSNFNLGSIPEDMGLETMDTADLDTTLTESNQVNIVEQRHDRKRTITRIVYFIMLWLCREPALDQATAALGRAQGWRPISWSPVCPSWARTWARTSCRPSSTTRSNSNNSNRRIPYGYDPAHSATNCENLWPSELKKNVCVPIWCDMTRSISQFYVRTKNIQIKINPLQILLMGAVARLSAYVVYWYNEVTKQNHDQSFIDQLQARMNHADQSCAWSLACYLVNLE